MHFIEDDGELAQLHQLGLGFIYNDYSGPRPSGAQYNVLHTAKCQFVGNSNTRYPKIFFKDLIAAVNRLSEYRGGEGTGWRRCSCCKSEHTLQRHPSSEMGWALSHNPPRLPVGKSVNESLIVPKNNEPPFTEGRVEDHLQPWLEANGYAVKKRVRVANGIIDIVAIRQSSEWIIEAKGEDRGGYNSAEMNFRIGISQICSRMEVGHGRSFGLAIPMTTHFKRVLIKHRNFSVFEQMRIWLLIASADGIITALQPADVQNYVNDLKSK